LVDTINAANETAPKVQKSVKSSRFRDSTLPSKHRSSKEQEYAELYGTSESAPVSTKAPKEEGGDVAYGAGHPEAKPAGYSDPKYDPYIRSKYRF
jgi:hypothetical protein